MMAISRQVHFASLMITVALMIGSVPAQEVAVNPSFFADCDFLDPPVYEFCHPDNITAIVNPVTTQFIIQSPNFGNGDYPNNVNCLLNIELFGPPVVLSYYFRYFDVEDELFCGYDSLTVNGVKYCGTWQHGRMLPSRLPPPSVSTLRFITDYSVTKPGFQIVVTPGNQFYPGPDDDDTPSK